SFGTCLEDMGYLPPGRGYYVIGFEGDSTANANIVSNGGECTNGQSLQTPAKQVKVGGQVAAVGHLPANSKVPNDGSTFQVGAAAFISSDAGAVPDQWYIDQDKNLVQAQRGY